MTTNDQVIGKIQGRQFSRLKEYWMIKVMMKRNIFYETLTLKTEL